MKDLYIDFLFSKGYFVATEEEADHPIETLVSMGNLFDIHIVSGHALASQEMIRVASKNLGEHVPLPFYRGFPETVRNLSPDRKLFDQLVHYTVTYGFGDFSKAGHSLFEGEFSRAIFREKTNAKPYEILTVEQALEKLEDYVSSLLESSRPLNNNQYALVLNYVGDYALEVKACPCKDTLIRLLLDTRKDCYAQMLSLSDVIRLVERLNYSVYHSKDVKKLNLRNQDRKLLTQVLNTIFQSGHCDVRNCFEKKKLWNGLLHHIHYQPVNEKAKEFVAAMRGDQNHSVWSTFEYMLDKSDVTGAVAYLAQQKGGAAVLRSLNYLLSRCKTTEEMDTILSYANSKNKIVLIQLLLQYSNYREDEIRTFKFTKFEMLRKHRETEEEVEKRRSRISQDQVSYVCKILWNYLETACKNTLGKVYIDEGMEKIALPLQETASMGGVGVLPKGSRVPMAWGKKLRAFTYWEKVNDIDLSVIGLGENGLKELEFSWRTMYSNENTAILFSGDQTSGYDGGSEYFDVNLTTYLEQYPDIRYLVFSNNVYSNMLFSQCHCIAGYMIRDEEDSGEVFEPKTVETSYKITCDSRYAYLFAIDVQNRELVWLNMANDSMQNVAAMSPAAFLLYYMNITDVINLASFARLLATEVVDRPEEADVVIGDRQLPMKEGAQQVRSCDFEQVLSWLQTMK